jgi:hypothetical protein
MEVLIQDLVRNNYLIPFRITDDHINETVDHPTGSKTIDFGGYILTLFLRKFDNHFILVDGRRGATSPLNISSAFKFDHSLIENLPISNVLEVLQRFANEFGAEIRIGDQTGKFIHSATIRVPRANVRGFEDLQRIVSQNIIITDNERPTNGGFLMDMVQNARELGSDLEVTLALVYCINTERYTTYLRSNNLL